MTGEIVAFAGSHGKFFLPQPSLAQHSRSSIALVSRQSPPRDIFLLQKQLGRRSERTFTIFVLLFLFLYFSWQIARYVLDGGLPCNMLTELKWCLVAGVLYRMLMSKHVLRWWRPSTPASAYITNIWNLGLDVSVWADVIVVWYILLDECD